MATHAMRGDDVTLLLPAPDIGRYLNRVTCAEATDFLRGLPTGSVQTLITSPPYYGLRDYGVDGQIGLEETPAEFVAKLVAVFREARRVLRDDGTIWINLGDSYANDDKWGGATGGKHVTDLHGNGSVGREKKATGLPPKSLIGIPWRVAFALQDDGWILRSDIVWSKPNPMPESVTDRPTKAHEYVFLFAKGQWKTRIVKLSDLPGERFHFFNNFGAQASYSGACILCVSLASSILDITQKQHQVSLFTFNSEIRDHGSGDSNSAGIADRPEIHRIALLSARFLSADIAAKDFLEQLQGFGLALTDRNSLCIAGGLIEVALPPGVFVDGKTTIGIKHSGQVCKFDFVHSNIITETPSSGNYYYDADAIAENSIESWTYDQSRRIQRVKASGGAISGGTGISVSRGEKRNKRTVWTVATEPNSFAHFATFPTKLITPMILAGAPVGGIVLDPFAGSGTTLLVARNLGRVGIGCDLNPEYAALANDRLSKPFTLPMLEMFA